MRSVRQLVVDMGQSRSLGRRCIGSHEAKPSTSGLWYNGADFVGEGKGSDALVPAKRVLSHDRSRDLLCSDTATLSGTAALAAATTRRHSTIPSAMHPSSSATWN